MGAATFLTFSLTLSVFGADDELARIRTTFDSDLAADFLVVFLALATLFAAFL